MSQATMLNTETDNSATDLLAVNAANASIGIFDSGIGGLTIVDDIKALLPDEHFIYLADNKYAPYGEKSPEFIIQRVNEIADFFIAQNVKAIVIACNTATVIAIDQLRKRINIPVIGVEPAIKPAALTTKKQKVAILTTQATANNTRFLALVKAHSGNAEIYIQPCPGLVQQIEQGLFDDEQTLALLSQYLLPLKTKGIDKLVLGCTHYPMLTKQIAQLIGNEIELIDTGLPVAKQLKNILTQKNLLTTQASKPAIWLASQTFSDTIQRVFNYPWQLTTLSTSPTNSLSTK